MESAIIAEPHSRKLTFNNLTQLLRYWSKLSLGKVAVVVVADLSASFIYLRVSDSLRYNLKINPHNLTHYH
jgi:hypothetical protein